MKGYRTIVFNLVSLIVMIGGAALQYVGDLGLTDPQAAIAGLIATIIVNVGNMYLRTVTTTPVGKK
tara:strand:+ start:28567 stop:28764 length:198 start_codon:yes stop_codon:yes gene_type:complete